MQAGGIEQSKHFQAKWEPVRVKKMRPDKEISDPISFGQIE